MARSSTALSAQNSSLNTSSRATTEIENEKGNSRSDAVPAAAHAPLTPQTTADSSSSTPCSGERENKQEGALNSKIPFTQSSQVSLDNGVVTKSNLEKKQDTEDEILRKQMDKLYEKAKNLFMLDPGPKEDHILDLNSEAKRIKNRIYITKSDITAMEENIKQLKKAIKESKIFKISQKDRDLL